MRIFCCESSQLPQKAAALFAMSVAFTLTLFAGLVPAYADDETAQTVRFGVISDTHVTPTEYTRQERLKNAFAFYGGAGADAVVVVGDLTNDGSAAQLNQWKE